MHLLQYDYFMFWYVLFCLKYDIIVLICYFKLEAAECICKILYVALYCNIMVLYPTKYYIYWYQHFIAVYT